MVPVIAALLTTLAQNGLGLLSSAIQAKGREVIEEKLGIAIPDNPSSEELTALRQAQYDHEERLLELGIEKEKQDLEGFKAEVDDRNSARTRDTALIQSHTHNYRADILVVIAAVGVAILVLIVWSRQELNEYMKGIVTLVLGNFLSYLNNIYNFEFGTTRGSKEKDATIKNLSGGAE